MLVVNCFADARGLFYIDTASGQIKTTRILTRNEIPGGIIIFEVDVGFLFLYLFKTVLSRHS